MKTAFLFLIGTVLIKIFCFELRADDPLNLPPPTGEIALSDPTALAEAPGPAPSPFNYTEFTVETQGPALQFKALDDNGARFVPDLGGEVGPNHVMTTLNSQIRIQTRTGTNLFTDTLNNWWNSHGCVGYARDPAVIYDPYSNRWVVTSTLDAELPHTAGIGVAVSPGGDPTSTNWHFFKILTDPVNENVKPDFPKLGLNKRWIALSFAKYNKLLTEYLGPRVYFFDKTNLYAGATNLVMKEFDSTIGTLYPAKTYDQSIDILYFLSAQVFLNSEQNGLFRFRAVPTGTNITLSAITPAAAGPKWKPFPECGNICNFAPQTNSTQKISNNDHRLCGVVYRDGFLWTAHTIFLPATGTITHSAIQWWQIQAANTGITAVASRGIVDDYGPTGADYAFPSLAVNKFHDLLIGFSQFSSTNYGSAAYIVNPPSANVTWMHAAPKIYHWGEDIFWRDPGTGVNRWGDYSSTWVDPADDTHFWTLQEYAAHRDLNAENQRAGRFGAEWARVQVEIPANDLFTNAFVLSGSTFRTNFTIFRAASEPNEPHHAGVDPVATVWFKWTAPANGPVTIAAVLEGTDPLDGDWNQAPLDYAVYTGSSFPNLSVTVSNSEMNVLWSPPGVNFTAVSNTTYQIAVNSRVQTLQAFELHLDQPAAPLFLQPLPKDIHRLASNEVQIASHAIANPNPAFQWRRNGTNIVGATFATITNLNIQMLDAGSYDVVATNIYGTNVSSIARLFVYDSAAASMTDFRFDPSNYLVTTITGATTYNYEVDWTADFTNWFPVTTNRASFDFTNIPTTNLYKFFRVIFKP